jgi:hypothetical protein
MKTFSFYRYFILQFKVEFDYKILHHTEVPWHTGWESLLYSVKQTISLLKGSEANINLHLKYTPGTV